jgi:hypothetical protein
MSAQPDTNELQFALRVRRALDESAAALPGAAAARLARARSAALARKKPEAARQFALVSALSGGGGARPGPERARVGAFQRLGLLWPLAALLLTLSGIAYFEDQQRLAEVADIDAAMLSDKLPLDAYLDHGFNAYLSHTR